MKKNRTSQDELKTNNKIYLALQDKLEKKFEYDLSVGLALSELLGEPQDDEPLLIPALRGRVPSDMRVHTEGRNDTAIENEGKKVDFPATTNSGVERSRNQNKEPKKTSDNANRYASLPGYGGYDGGCTIGYDGHWKQEDGMENATIFDGLKPIFEKAKFESQEIKDGGYFDLNGMTFKMLPKSSGGPVNYQYVMESNGLKFLIHGNAKKGMQPVRVEFGFSALDGKNLYCLGEKVRQWLFEIGFVVEMEKISRVDLQATIQLDFMELYRLIHNNQYVSRAHKGKIYFDRSRTESFTSGQITQICIYDKFQELLDHQDEFKMKAVYSHFQTEEMQTYYLTRVEFRLKRDALKNMNINSLDDLKQVEHHLIEYLCKDWFRIIERPKTKGNTTKVKIHPLWQRIIQIFHENFNQEISSEDQKPLQFRNKKIIRCSAHRLVKQAIGCIASAAGLTLGSQSLPVKTFNFVKDFFDSHFLEIYEKGNVRSRYWEEVKGYCSPESSIYGMKETCKRIISFNP